WNHRSLPHIPHHLRSSHRPFPHRLCHPRCPSPLCNHLPSMLLQIVLPHPDRESQIYILRRLLPYPPPHLTPPPTHPTPSPHPSSPLHPPHFHIFTLKTTPTASIHPLQQTNEPLPYPHPPQPTPYILPSHTIIRPLNVQKHQPQISPLQPRNLNQLSHHI